MDKQQEIPVQDLLMQIGEQQVEIRALRVRLAMYQQALVASAPTPREADLVEKQGVKEES